MVNTKIKHIFVFAIAVFILAVSSCKKYSPKLLWIVTYGGENHNYGTSLQQTKDGGFIIAGYTSTQETDTLVASREIIFLLKVDSSGNYQWNEYYPESWLDYAASVKQTKDGGFIIAGTVSREPGLHGNPRYSDICLIKTDSNGSHQWTKIFGGEDDDHGDCVLQTTDNGYIIVGNTESYGAGEDDVYIVKTDSLGDSLWTKTYGGKKDDVGNSINFTSDGGFIITGFTESSGMGDRDLYLIKVDANGDLLWEKTFGGKHLDWGYSVQQTSDGGYIIAGNTCSVGPGTPEYTNVYLVKTDEKGTLCWEKTYDGSENPKYALPDEASSVQQTSDGGYVIAGNTMSVQGKGMGDIYIIKTDENGNTIWTKIYGDESFDGSNEIIQTTDGGYAVVGHLYKKGSNHNQVCLIRLDREH